MLSEGAVPHSYSRTPAPAQGTCSSYRTTRPLVTSTAREPDDCLIVAVLQPVPATLALGCAADQPLRSPVVDKLRLEDSSPFTELERFPPQLAPKTPPPPRSPLLLPGRCREGVAAVSGQPGRPPAQ